MPFFQKHGRSKKNNYAKRPRWHNGNIILVQDDFLFSFKLHLLIFGATVEGNHRHTINLFSRYVDMFVLCLKCMWHLYSHDGNTLDYGRHMAVMASEFSSGSSCPKTSHLHCKNIRADIPQTPFKEANSTTSYYLTKSLIPPVLFATISSEKRFPLKPLPIQSNIHLPVENCRWHSCHKTGLYLSKVPGVLEQTQMVSRCSNISRHPWGENTSKQVVYKNTPTGMT